MPSATLRKPLVAWYTSQQRRNGLFSALEVCPSSRSTHGWLYSNRKVTQLWLFVCFWEIAKFSLCKCHYNYNCWPTKPLVFTVCTLCLHVQWNKTFYPLGSILERFYCTPLLRKGNIHLYCIHDSWLTIFHWGTVALALQWGWYPLWHEGSWVHCRSRPKRWAQSQPLSAVHPMTEGNKICMDE